jgi:Tfp pilus assembly protein PilE
MILNRSRTGTTLIELLGVLVVIGVLTTIAVPRYSASKEKAYVAVMQSDLRNAASYEEQYAAENGGIYFSGTATYDMPYNTYKPSKDVTVTFLAFNLVPAALPGYSATATHAGTSHLCKMRTGVVTCTTGKDQATALIPF